MEIEIFETHAHLDMEKFDPDREEVIKRALGAGVTRMVTIGIDVASSKKAINLAEKYPFIYASVGFHPHDTRFMSPSDIATLSDLAKNPRVVAIGEIGLDYYRLLSSREIQINAFKELLKLATGARLPVIIHSRQAEQDTIGILKEWLRAPGAGRSPEVGVIHCFSGDLATAKIYLDMGFYIAFGAYIGYPGSRLPEVIRYIPAERLVVETDCPFLPPQSYRGKRNEPSYLPLTVRLISQIRNEPYELVARQTTENAMRLFNLNSKRLPVQS